MSEYNGVFIVAHLSSIEYDCKKWTNLLEGKGLLLPTCNKMDCKKKNCYSTIPINRPDYDIPNFIAKTEEDAESLIKNEAIKFIEKFCANISKDLEDYTIKWGYFKGNDNKFSVKTEWLVTCKVI